MTAGPAPTVAATATSAPKWVPAIPSAALSRAVALKIGSSAAAPPRKATGRDPHAAGPGPLAPTRTRCVGNVESSTHV